MNLVSTKEEIQKVQSSLLQRYFELNNQPSFREIAQDTGIQQTRVFRIFNGQELKLNEYLIFKRRVDELSGMGGDFWDIAQELQKSLSSTKLKLVMRKLQREIQYSRLSNEKLA